MATFHKGLSRLIPPRPKDSKSDPGKNLAHQGDYQPSISEQQASLTNRLSQIQDAVADAVSQPEEFV